MRLGQSGEEATWGEDRCEEVDVEFVIEMRSEKIKEKKKKIEAANEKKFFKNIDKNQTK